ncbi:MAG TPA: hypothetical protein VFS66_06270 [Acidimicrobiia bacterium]|nr:hypothetical protein [Acidimicrobiia bacterium]
MDGWVRWLVVAVAVVLIVVLVGYARGERQRGEEVPVTGQPVLVVVNGSLA